MKVVFFLCILLSSFTQASDNLTGDWNGARTNLSEKHGIDFEVVYTGELVNNLSGGNHKGGIHLGNIDTSIEVNLDKLIGWKGAKAKVYGLGNYGSDPTEIIGDTQGTSNIETNANTYKIYEAWIDQSLLNDKLSILFGLYDLNSEFYVTDSSGLFFNSSFGIGADFSQTGVNGPSIFPTTSLATRLKIIPHKDMYILIAAFDAVPGKSDRPHGTQIDTSSKEGYLYSTEIGFESNSNKLGLGYWSYSKKVDDLVALDSSGNAKKEKNFGAYLLASTTFKRSYNLFLRIGFANKNVNAISSNISTGVSINEASWLRDGDEFGFGISKVKNSSANLQNLKASGEIAESSETAYELTYKYALKRWLSLRPDFQYIVNPGMSKTLKNASIFSLRLEINL